VAHRDGDKLLAAWSDSAFVEALDSLAKAHGMTRSELIRAALLKAALEVPDQDSNPSSRGG
jgi:metal-responsive CopG/Arc/MetJ family transcriptional regulator